MLSGSSLASIIIVITAVSVLLIVHAINLQRRQHLKPTIPIMVSVFLTVITSLAVCTGIGWFSKHHVQSSIDSSSSSSGSKIVPVTDSSPYYDITEMMCYIDQGQPPF